MDKELIKQQIVLFENITKTIKVIGDNIIIIIDLIQDLSNKITDVEYNTRVGEDRVK